LTAADIHSVSFVSIPHEHSLKGFTGLMSTWVGITVIAWVLMSVVLSIAVGGMIRLADSRRLAAPQDEEKVRQMRRSAAQDGSLRRVS